MKDKRDLTFKDFQTFKSALVETGNSQAVDIFTIIFNTGLRISEVLNLKFSDVDFNSNSITVEKMRSATNYKLTLNDECMKAIRRLKDKYSKDIFVFQSRNSRNQKNKPASSISRQVVNKVFKEVSNSTSLPITINSLRQTYVVQVVKESFSSGSDLANLSKIMGHVPTNMTNHYVNSCNIKNNEEPNCLSAPKVDLKPEIIEFLLNGTSLNENSDLNDICQKCDISESDLIVTLRTITILRKHF